MLVKLQIPGPDPALDKQNTWKWLQKYGRPLNKTSLNCPGPLPITRFRILRFNHLQIENNIFTFPTAVFQQQMETIFHMRLVESMDAKG